MNMAIKTAGQQKYADLTAKRIKSLQMRMYGYTICINYNDIIFCNQKLFFL